MRSAFISTLIEQAYYDERIFLLTPDMGYSVLEKFQEAFPDRFVNTGISEQNTISVAAGLALSGHIVYVYSIIPFITMRCYEQIRIDVAYMNLNVRIVGVGAGYSYGSAGATHHSIEDIAIMRVLPNMTVCCPGDPKEAAVITKESNYYSGPMYIRLGKNGEPKVHEKDVDFKIGKSIKLIEGNDLAIITTSNVLGLGKQWVDKLSEYKKRAALISMPTIKPFDKEAIISLIKSGIPIITIEEHNIIGGLGSAVAEVIADFGHCVPFKRIAVNDEFTHFVGNQELLREKMGISFQKVLDFLNL